MHKSISLNQKKLLGFKLQASDGQSQQAAKGAKIGKKTTIQTPITGAKIGKGGGGGTGTIGVAMGAKIGKGGGGGTGTIGGAMGGISTIDA